SPAFLSIVAAPAMSILDSQVVKAHGGTDAADADQTDQAKDWLNQNSAGSGPFMLAGWTPKGEIVLEANPNHWRGAPELDKVIIKHVADASTQLELLQRGEADIVHALDMGLVDQVLDDPNLTLITGQTLNMTYLAMSPDHELGGPMWSPQSSTALNGRQRSGTSSKYGWTTCPSSWSTSPSSWWLCPQKSEVSSMTPFSLLTFPT
ncbi:MAG: ABC transporter substrate-binding protein, partial [Anaerolineae bacterium]